MHGDDILALLVSLARGDGGVLWSVRESVLADLQAIFQTRPAGKERQTSFFRSPPHRLDTLRTDSHLHSTVDKSTTCSQELLVHVGTTF